MRIENDEIGIDERGVSFWESGEGEVSWGGDVFDGWVGWYV